jgi:FAD-dependent halogenase
VHRIKGQASEFARALDTVVANKEASMLPLFRSSVVRQAMLESGQIQQRALLGEYMETEAPLFAGGLIPSADGMFWSASSA